MSEHSERTRRIGGLLGWLGVHDHGAPAFYRATATASDAAGNLSKPSTAAFTIVR